MGSTLQGCPGSHMRPRLLAILAVLALSLTGCFDEPVGIGTPRNIHENGRLTIIEDNGYTAVLQDSKTGCEFVYAYVHDGLALIPGTCRSECPGQ